MNIKRSIDQNYKLIGLIIIGIIFILFIIKSLNMIYENREEKKQSELFDSNNQTAETSEGNSIEKTIKSFVNYCNQREIENAYNMLTEECKKAMFPTIQDFERIYINIVYKNQREYEMMPWYTYKNRYTYQVKLYGDILATGDPNNYKVEYYTFIKDDEGNYKLNINNYIYGEDRNIKQTKNGIIVEIGHVDVYEDYETATIKITNISTKTISLTGDTYRKNIYLQNGLGTTYSSLNSEFDNQNIILEPKASKTFTVDFNKAYDGSNNANYLVLSDVILDYEDYSNATDKANYDNRTSIKIKYQK